MHHDSAHRRTAAALVTSLALAVGACGGGDASPASASGPAPAAVPSPGRSIATELPSSRAQLPLPADIPTATLSAEVDGVVATGRITPEDGGVVRGKDASGTAYSLTVARFSVTSDVTVSIRPLHGSTELGTIIAGAELLPAGLRLLRPAMLTIESPAIGPGWAAFDYRGSAPGARARLAMAAYPEAEVVEMVIPHFSGSVAVDLGSNANSLYEKWAGTRGDDTPTGRQAAAEVRYSAATMAEQSGRVSPETAAGIRDRAASDWIAAERDRLATDPDMLALADGGRPADLDALSAEVGRIIEFEARRAAAGDDADLGSLAPAVDVLVRYETAITSKVLDSAEIGRAADSGRVSDIGEMLDLFQLIAGLDRQIQLLGGPETAGVAKMVDLLARVRSGLLRTCKDAPVDPALILGLERFLQLVGAAASPGLTFADIADCAGIANAPTPRGVLHRITGQLTLDHVSDRGDRAHAVFDLIIVEDVGAALVFASGSHAKVDWTLAKPWEGCPTAGSSTVTIGSLSNEVVSRLSDPSPGALGLPIRRGGDLELSGLAIPGFQRGTGDHGVMCLFPALSLTCGPVAFTGKLIHANPAEWTFSCSSGEQGEFWSTDGRLLATE